MAEENNKDLNLHNDCLQKESKDCLCSNAKEVCNCNTLFRDRSSPQKPNLDNCAEKPCTARIPMLRLSKLNAQDIELIQQQLRNGKKIIGFSPPGEHRVQNVNLPNIGRSEHVDKPQLEKQVKADSGKRPQSHIKPHQTNRKPVSCKLCGKTFTSAGGIRLHLLAHRKTKCEFCSEECADRKDFLEHFKIHKDEARFHCSDCPKFFFNAESLRSHLRIHEYNRYSCDKCGKVYKSKPALNLHISEAHLESGQKKCPFCNKVSKHFGTLTRHIKKCT